MHGLANFKFINSLLSWFYISSHPDNVKLAPRYWNITEAGDHKYFRPAFVKQRNALKLQAWGLQRYGIALETCIQQRIVLANVSLIILLFCSCNFVLLAGLARQHSRTKRRLVCAAKHFTAPFALCYMIINFFCSFVHTVTITQIGSHLNTMCRPQQCK
jgi:hypothetical protein